ncbi:hypothetical protein ACFL5O_00310 [Myxococcota bacterium]
MAAIGPAQLISQLAEHPHLEPLAIHVRSVLFDAARKRDPSAWLGGGKTSVALTSQQADTEHGNVLSILEQGPNRPTEQALIAALLARDIADRPPGAPEAWLRVAANLAWIAGHTPFSAFESLEVLLRGRSDSLWGALADVALAPESAGGGRAEALVAVAALCASSTDRSRELVNRIAGEAADPLLKAAASGTQPSSEAGRLTGQVRPAPKGPWATGFLGITGLLFCRGACSLIGRYALGFRRPADVWLSHRGLELRARAELLGRVLHESYQVVPLGELSRATREVKYSRIGLYAGLIALVLGSYLGVGLFVDGIRVPGSSPSLMGLGVLLMAGGLVLDFALSRLSDTVSGQCSLVVVPRKGRVWCVGGLDLVQTDEMLRQVAESTQAVAARRTSPPMSQEQAKARPLTTSSLTPENLAPERAMGDTPPATNAANLEPSPGDQGR